MSQQCKQVGKAVWQHSLEEPPLVFLAIDVYFVVTFDTQVLPCSPQGALPPNVGTWGGHPFPSLWNGPAPCRTGFFLSLKYKEFSSILPCNFYMLADRQLLA